MQDQSVESEETLRESGSRGDGLYRQRVSALADLSVAERNLFGDQFRGMSRACGGRHCGAAGLRLYICSSCAGNLSKSDKWLFSIAEWR